LWIELLKNAYYNDANGYKELQTLPNIDINIKQGNSLVSRFDVSDTKFTKGDKRTLEEY
jgi:adenine-specific DNA-methyltransferase